jgi:hypothetical protein
MRLSVLSIAALLVTSSQLVAQNALPADSEPATGTRVRFWYRAVGPGRWYEGLLGKMFPPGEVCLVVMSNDLQYVVTLPHIDSLQIDRSGWYRRPGYLLDGPSPVWSTISPSVLHGTENCTQ